MDANLFKREAYEYDLPKELIAQKPAARRDESRLMLIDRSSKKISLHQFNEITTILNPGDRLVLNNTKVIPAKLVGHRATGGKVEFLLFKQEDTGAWKALTKPYRKLNKGDVVSFGGLLDSRIEEKLGEGICLVNFLTDKPIMEALEEVGTMPLPHYIHRQQLDASDQERYQTVYAKEFGACAAPTAGLHFTQELLESLSQKGISQDYVTLHVGLGTFKPVTVDDVREHKMHVESYFVDENNAQRLSSPIEGRRITVGTTCCRVLESLAQENKIIPPGEGETGIFIYPGYQFKYVDHLLTNFHLPGSTLMMLVSAFAGYDLIMEAYRKAVEEKFRFFSYGDAMLIL